MMVLGLSISQATLLKSTEAFKTTLVEAQQGQIKQQQAPLLNKNSNLSPGTIEFQQNMAKVQAWEAKHTALDLLKKREERNVAMAKEMEESAQKIEAANAKTFGLIGGTSSTT